MYYGKHRPTHSSRAAGTLAAFPLFPQLAPEFKLEIYDNFLTLEVKFVKNYNTLILRFYSEIISFEIQTTKIHNVN